MKKFGSYTILKKEKIIVEYHSGDINIDEFINSRKIISSDINYNPDYDLVFDYRDANMLVKEPDIDMFLIFFKNFPQIIGKRKSAYLTSKPNEVVITTLFSLGIKDTYIHPQTFSSPEGVIDWVNNKDLNINSLRKILEKLKKGPNNLYS